MSSAKKFNTFGGVFTPSILTILGVIMYLRLPWIVGQAGIITTIGIILVAHFVSITTGLSISSIATDKKVKAGGTYYIISRSLGLPIGGALGIALFLGLSLSASLYIIGFAESFLSYIGFASDIDTIRLTGTIVLLLVTIITLISTAFAIKAQYFIMAAIILSLVSIFFGNFDLSPAEPMMDSHEDMPSLIYIFAIFFPAVTGFGAGVTMSGDLKDTKKSIPFGTMSAIIVGLVIYVGLTLFLGYYVDAEQLRNNPNILLEISLYAPFVVAGIWGATISSAIGSILGAPRILQATSADSITAKVFGKGKGKENEPRNALLLTFIIAEIGILIGDLNLIARLVSMFFITTYGFLNLSCALENWASTDFRPSFKIPIWVSGLGAIVSFVLMVELDFVAFIGAVLIMGFLFFFLKRKELTLESGDTWEGIWSSILRSSLSKLNGIVKQQRNWRPNILLFSKDTDDSKAQIQLGEWLVHKRGIMSHFKMKIKADSTEQISKLLHINENKEALRGVFYKEMTVNNYYDSIELVSKLYGFSGLEPNTVMFSWDDFKDSPKELDRVINSFKQEDMNIFLLKVDAQLQLSSKKTLDIWWTREESFIPLSLSIFKFLNLSQGWEKVKSRIIMNNASNVDDEKLLKNVRSILDEQRIEIDLKIINNLSSKKTLTEHVSENSADTDLIIIELPENLSKDQFIEFTEAIANFKSVLIVKASKFFNPIKIGLEDKPVNELIENTNEHYDFNNINFPEDVVLSLHARTIITELSELSNKLENELIIQVKLEFDLINDELVKLDDKIYQDLTALLDIEEVVRRKKKLNQIKSAFHFKLMKQTINDFSAYFDQIYAHFENSLDLFRKQMTSIINLIPENVVITYDIDDPHYQKLSKSIFEKLFSKEKSLKRNTDIRQLLKYYEIVISRKIILQSISKLGLLSQQIISELHVYLNQRSKVFAAVFESINNENYNTELLSQIDHQLQTNRTKFKNLIDEEFHKISNSYRQSFFQSGKALSNDINDYHFKKIIAQKIKIAIRKKSDQLTTDAFSEFFQHSIYTLLNQLEENITVKNLVNRVDVVLNRTKKELISVVNVKFINQMTQIKSAVHDASEIKTEINWSNLEKEIRNLDSLIDGLDKDLLEITSSLPEDLELFDESVLSNLAKDQFSSQPTINLNLKRYSKFVLENTVLDSISTFVRKSIEQLNIVNESTLDILRFINYNLDIQDSEIDSKDTFPDIVQTTEVRLNQQIETLELLKDEIEQNFSSFTESFHSKFLSSEIHNSSNSAVKMNVIDNSRLKGRIASGFDKVKMKTKNIGTKIVYTQSEGVLFYRKLGNLDSRNIGQHELNLEIIKNYIINERILQSLPIYYTKLFNGNYPVSKEFLIDRPLLMNSAKASIENFKSGSFGSLLILGERLSGKSILSTMIANRSFDKNKIYQLNADASSRNNAEDLRVKLSKLFKVNGNIDKIMQNIPNGSTLIINDLEMWWQRSHSGESTLELIIKLVKSYGNKCFFIINSTSNSYKIMNQIINLDQIFVKTIYCSAFKAEELQDAIMRRHRATGIKFQYDNKLEDELSGLKLATLFNAIFSAAKGNIGVSLIKWLIYIENVNDKFISIQKKKFNENKSLLSFPDAWNLVLIQILLHKKISKKDLIELLNKEEDDVSDLMNDLMRDNYVLEAEKNVFTINPSLIHIITQKFNSMELL